MSSKLTIDQILGGCQYPSLASLLKYWKHIALKNASLEFGFWCSILEANLGQGLVSSREYQDKISTFLLVKKARFRINILFFVRKMNFWFILASLFFGCLLFLAKPTLAAVRCETQYGGRQVCITTGQLQVNKQVFCDKLLIGNSDKQVCKDASDGFIDNMGENFHHFSPNEEIRFRISVKNVGDATFSKVTVTDTSPANFLQPVSGTLTFEFTDLKPGAVSQQEIKMKVLDTDRLSQNNIICVVNAAEASADGNRDRDTSQVCLERKVLGVGVSAAKQLPPTGAPGWLLTLGAMLILAAGAKLTRFKRIEFTESYYQMVENRFLKKGGDN